MEVGIILSKRKLHELTSNKLNIFGQVERPGAEGSARTACLNVIRIRGPSPVFDSLRIGKRKWSSTYFDDFNEFSCKIHKISRVMCHCAGSHYSISLSYLQVFFLFSSPP